MRVEKMKKILKFIKAQPMLVIAFAATLATMFIIPPDAEYLGYCNRTVLIQLFCLMAAVGGFRSIGLFEKATAILLKSAGTVRRLGIILTLICFFTSMLLTNDVALITFVPLTLLVYSYIPDEKSRIFTIVLETAAANLGSMVTPFGNPQNLYLYDVYELRVGDFFGTMLPVGILSLILLLLLCLILPKDKCTAKITEQQKIPIMKCAVYIALFLICLLTVFRVIPDWLCLISAVIISAILNWRLLLKVDYCLIATFVCFFVFVGNIARIEAVREFFSEVLAEREVIISVLLSQVISNVPAAVMLSEFTENGKALLLGVNIGGLGTIIASLASLISFQYYRSSEGARSGKYMLVFSAVNIGLLAILMLFSITIYAY